MVYNHHHIKRKSECELSMLRKRREAVHKCCCSECNERPGGEIAKLHASINRLAASLDEKHCRQFAGLLASQLGHGGIQYLSKITGLGRNTISRGKQEIRRVNKASDGRIRAPGGGRQKVEKKSQA